MSAILPSNGATGRFKSPSAFAFKPEPSFAEVDTQAITGFGLGFDIELAITQAMSNVLFHLQVLRTHLETSDRKEIDDVRNVGETTGSILLRGIEDQVSYMDLVDLIDALEMGLARRRIELADD